MNEQVKPLAPAGYQVGRDQEDEAISSGTLRRRRCLQCCGCITALLLVAMVIIIVIAIVCHFKNPSIKINSITIQGLELLKNGSSSSGGNEKNITLIVDVSVKNPNYNSFKYDNTTTCIYYGGLVVGEGQIPPGIAKGRRTLRMNVTVDIIPGKILTVPSLKSDALSGLLNIGSYTRITGKVKILNIVDESVVVKMNCSFSNIWSHNVQKKCRRQG